MSTITERINANERDKLNMTLRIKAMGVYLNPAQLEADIAALTARLLCRHERIHTAEVRSTCLDCGGSTR